MSLHLLPADDRLIEILKLVEQVDSAFDASLDVSHARTEGNFVDWQRISVVLGALVAQPSNLEPIRVVGISGSQGSGKSTLAESLVTAINQARQQEHGAALCSLDDFYLTRAQRLRLADEVHPLLATRGVPGTHDWQWLQRVLDAQREDNPKLQLPRFDKGLDDRAGVTDVQARTLVLEGWCLGVQPQPQADLLEPCNAMEHQMDSQGVWRRWVNEMIEAHYVDLWRQVDFWIHLRVPSFTQVQQWRSEQEQQLPAAQRMTEAEIGNFIAHYERLTRWMWASPMMGPGMVVQLDESHQVVGIEVSAKAWF